MQLVDLSKPGEKKKLIWAAILGLIAIVFLWWTLIGFDSGTPSTASRPTPSPAQQRTSQTPSRDGTALPSTQVLDLTKFTEIKFETTSYSAPEPRRNIFSYYEPTPTPTPVATTPTPTPEPPPPILLASINPSNVYARTADFKLEVAGDKFTPQMRIFVDGREMPTAYKNPQQLSTTVTASFITNPGVRQVVVRTPDNKLYSNPMPINVAAPPAPNYMFVGIFGSHNRVEDVALVQERNNKNILNVKRGDVLGRFRVTSISDKELVLTDTALKIKHTIAMTEPDKGSGPLSRPTPRVDAEDDEP
jgi:hypothetical protein